MIYDPLTKLQCSPTSDGSGAAILAREAFVDKHGLAGQAIEIVGQAMTTDFAVTFDGTAMALIGYDMNVQAAQQVYEQSGLSPEDFQVIELHDCFSANELLLYEALGLCGRGRGAQADRQRRHHLRRPVGGQPLRRADLQGASAGRDRFGAVRRTDLAAARRRRQASGRQRHRGVATQHRTRWSGRRHRISARRPLKRMFEWSDTDLMVRDAVRQFVDKEIRPHLDELETGELSPYPIARKLFSQFGSTPWPPNR